MAVDFEIRNDLEKRSLVGIDGLNERLNRNICVLTGLCKRECRNRQNVQSVLARSLSTFSEKSKLQTSEEVREKWKVMTDAVKEQFRSDPDKFIKLIGSAVPQSQDELPSRTMTESYQEVLLQLGQNKEMQLKYKNTNNSIRFGRILEDLDSFAGVIAYNYHQNPKFGSVCPIPIVTALVDRIDNQWLNMLDARILMVARHPLTQKSTFINPLVRETPEEEEIFNLGEARNRKRKENSQKSLLKVPPSEQERELIHNMFLQTINVKSGSLRARLKPDNCVWMHDTLLKNLTICFPEQRNFLNKIFGGFVLRTALELAWANASTFSKSRPLIKAVGDVNFNRPVEIGSLLYMSSQILFTEGSRLLAKVHAEVVDPETRHRETTNEMYFTFETNKASLPCVIPQTYSETMLYLDGKRHYEE